MLWCGSIAIAGLQPKVDIDALTSRKSSIFFWRMVGSMFMRVNSKCAQPGAPTTRPDTEGRVRLGNLQLVVT